MLHKLNESSPMGSGSRAVTVVGVCSVIAIVGEMVFGIPQTVTLPVCTGLAGIWAAVWKSLRSPM